MKEKKISPLIGYQSILQQFTDMMAAGNFAPVNLIYGAEGIGKRIFCENLASNLLEFDKTSYSDLLSHPDLLIIEADSESSKQEITIDLTRKIKKFFSLTPSQAKCQLVIIDNVESLNIHAANSILKILEEPNDNKYFLLISHNLNLVLDTIISRCKKTHLPYLSKTDFYKILETQNIENLDIDKTDILYDLFPRQPGKAISFFNSGGIETLVEIKQLLEKTNYLNIKKFANSYDTKNLQIFKNFLIIMEHLSYKKFKILQKENNNNLIELNNFITSFRNSFFNTIGLNLDRKNFIVKSIEDFSLTI